jgi:hypothetical protein
VETTERPALVVHRPEPEIRVVAADVATDVAQFEWDLTTDRWWWSTQMYTLHGYAPRVVEPTLESLLEHQHPMDSERTRDAFAKACQDGRAFVFEHRLVAGDGVRTMILSVTPDVGLDGRPLRITGTLLDVSDARRLHHAADQDSIAGLQAEVMRLHANAESRQLVSQATGVLMERHKVTADEAVALLRRASQVCGRKLLDVASELLYTGKLVDGFPTQRVANKP